MLKRISTKISENEKIQKVMSSRIYKRLFISFLILAGLLTVIGNIETMRILQKLKIISLVPTWQVYTEEGRY